MVSFSRAGAVDVENLILLRPQCLHGLDVHRTTRWNIAGRQGNYDKDCRYPNIGCWVGWTDNDHAMQKTCHEDAGDNAKCQPDSDDPQPMSIYRFQDIQSSCPKSHANANFIGFLADNIGKYTVNTDDSEDEP